MPQPLVLVSKIGRQLRCFSRLRVKDACAVALKPRSFWTPGLAASTPVAFLAVAKGELTAPSFECQGNFKNVPAESQNSRNSATNTVSVLHVSRNGIN